MEEATGIPKTTIRRYLLVVRARTSPSAIQFGETINDIVGEVSRPERQREQRKATFGTAEAEYAIKLHRMAESTSSAEGHSRRSGQALRRLPPTIALPKSRHL